MSVEWGRSYKICGEISRALMKTRRAHGLLAQNRDKQQNMCRYNVIDKALNLQKNSWFIEVLNFTNCSISLILFYLGLVHSPRDTRFDALCSFVKIQRNLLFYSNA